MSDERRNVGDLYEQDGDVYLMTGRGGLVKLTGATISETTDQRYLANLNACLNKMRERYGTTATVTTTCARCSATIDPDAVERHHERCFVVGDWVRLEMLGRHLTGEVWSVDRNVLTVIPDAMHGEWYIGKVGKPFTIRIGDNSPKNLHHIQRPGQAARDAPPVRARWWPRGWSDEARYVDGVMVSSTHMTIEHIGPRWSSVDGNVTDTIDVMTRGGFQVLSGADPELQDAMERVALPSEDPWEQDPMDALYDGVTLRVLLLAAQGAAREQVTPLARSLTPAQRAAVGVHWSQQLKQRISAAKERERLSVCVQDQEEP